METSRPAPEFYCPLSGLIMESPVIIPQLNEITYESSIITDWIKHGKHPRGSKKICSKYEKLPNRAIKSRINTFLNECPAYKSDQFDDSVYQRMCEFMRSPDESTLYKFVEKNITFACKNFYLGESFFHFCCRKASPSILFDCMMELLSKSKYGSSLDQQLAVMRNYANETPLQLLFNKTNYQAPTTTEPLLMSLCVMKKNEKAVKYNASKYSAAQLNRLGFMLWLSVIGTDNAEIVKALVQKGADVNEPMPILCRDSVLLKSFDRVLSGKTKQTEVLTYLLRSGAVEAAGEVPILYSAIKQAQPNLVEIICKYHSKLDINEIFPHTKLTPLGTAVELNNLEIVIILMDHGACINTTFQVSTTFLSKNLITPLQLAIEKQFLGIIDKFVSCSRLDKSYQDQRGNSYLHTAVLSNSLETVGLLLANGFPFHLLDKTHLTPKSLAKKLDQPQTAHSIRTHTLSRQQIAHFEEKVQEITSALLEKQRIKHEAREAQLRTDLEISKGEIAVLKREQITLKQQLQVSRQECAQLKSSLPSITSQLASMQATIASLQGSAMRSHPAPADRATLRKLGGSTTAPPSAKKKEKPCLVIHNIDQRVSEDKKIEATPVKLQEVQEKNQTHKDATGQLSPRANRVFSAYRSSLASYTKSVQAAPYACTMTVGANKNTILILMLKFLREKKKGALSEEDVAKVKLLLAHGAEWNYANTKGDSASKH